MADGVESSMEETSVASQQKNPNFRVVNAEAGHVTLSQAHFDDLHAALQRMQLVVDESAATVKQYQEDMDCMRKVLTDVFLRF